MKNETPSKALENKLHAHLDVQDERLVEVGVLSWGGVLILEAPWKRLEVNVGPYGTILRLSWGLLVVILDLLA